MSAAPHCANITSAGQRRRRLGGWAAALAGAIVTAGLASRGAPARAYLVLFPFALGGAIGILEARDRTCVLLGLRGAAEVEGGGHRRLPAAERARGWIQARRVLLKSVALAIAVTLVAVLVAGIRITVSP